MPIWQLVAGWLAILLFAVGAFGVARLTRVVMLVLVLSFVGVPILAFATYAISPRPPSSLDVGYLGLPFVGLAFALVLASILLRIGQMQSTTFASILRRAPLFLLAWPCVVLALSCVVFIFEPGFAIANLAVNALWFVAWIPRTPRRVVATDTYELPAPREKVFAFTSRPSNWPLYNQDLESAVARPDGPLHEGSEIVARRRARYPGLRGPRLLLPSILETVEVVTRLVPNELLATRRIDGIDSNATIEMSSVDGRTLVKTRTAILMPYRLAVVGARLEMAVGAGKRKAAVQANRDRLRKLLEEPTAEG